MPSSPALLATPLTDMLGIKHPILLAGMNVAAGPELAAAVTNAGGLGVIGGSFDILFFRNFDPTKFERDVLGVGYTPKVLRQQIQAIKNDLEDKNAPFGVDLLIPQVGGNARKTNTDYTGGRLPEMIDVIIEEKAKLFVCAVGVPPKDVVEKLHKNGILVMNHVPKALAQGVDIICAQAGEGGGHTGDIPGTMLIPACVDAVKGHKSPLTGGPVYVVAAGAVYDGRGLAAYLMYGAQAVWVGTRFVASKEAGAPKKHKELVLEAGFEDTARTVIYSGRPLRVFKTPYVADWEENRQHEIKDLTSKGVIPHYHELENHPEKSLEGRPWLMGRVVAMIDEILSAKEIIDRMVKGAAEQLQRGNGLLVSKAKL